MPYAVKEIFYTLQGEGANAGTPAVFCRFSGCNLWSGREVDRATAVCRFCDTDFIGVSGSSGGHYNSAQELVDAMLAIVPPCFQPPMVVLTGGEPALQIDQALILCLHEAGFRVAVETNGTVSLPGGLDWICVSPKANARLEQTSGHELKVVVPQKGLDLAQLATLDFEHFFVQPMDGPDLALHTQYAIDFCLSHPNWRLSVQTHKVLGIR